MPPNPNMQNISSQLEMMQQAQSAQSGLFAGSMASLQQTIQALTEATRMGIMTARNSGSIALGSLQYGAATAIGDLQSIGGSIQAMTPGAGPAPMVGGQILAAGGGMRAGGVDIVHGASIGALTLGGGLAGFAGFEAVAGLGAMTGLGMGSFIRGGAMAGRVMMGGGLLGGAGAIAGGAIGGAAALAIPLLGAYAAEEVFTSAIQHTGAVRDINAIMNQQMWRNAPFDPNAPTNYRDMAQSIAKDISGIRGMNAGTATQIVGMGMELGLFQDVGREGADGIRGRARDLAEAVKEMSRLIGSSLEESMTMMAEVKQAGFDPTSAPGLIVQSRGMGRAGGFTASEMHMTGMRGAQMFRGTGVSPTFGFNAAQQSLAMASNLTLTGAVPQWLQASMGGRQAMGEAMTQGVANFINSPMGNVFAAALNAPGGAANLGKSFDELGAAATQGVGTTPGQYIEFLASRRRLLEDAGPEAIQAGRGQVIRRAFEREVLQNDPSYREVWESMTREQRGERYGEFAASRLTGPGALATSPDEARVLGQMAANPQTFDSQRQAMRAEMHRASMDQYMEEHGPMGWARKNLGDPIQRATQRVGAAIAEPFITVGGVAEDVTSDISNWMYGVESRTITEGDIGAFKQELVGGRTERVSGQILASGRKRGERFRISAPGAISGLGGAGLIEEVRRSEYEKDPGGFVQIGPPGTEGPVRVVRKASIDSLNAEAAAARNIIRGEAKYTASEKEAIGGALDQLYSAEGLTKNTADVLGQLADKSIPMEVRVNALQSLAYGLVPSVSAGTTGEEKERYNNIPGDSEEAKRTHIMNAIAKDSGTMEVFARAAKGLVIQSVTDSTAYEETAIQHLNEHLEGITEKSFGVTIDSNQQRRAIRSNITDIYRVMTEEVGGRERAKVFRRVAEAAGLGKAEAAQIQQRVQAAMSDPEFARNIRVGAVARRAEARGEIRERLEAAIGEGGVVTDEQIQAQLEKGDALGTQVTAKDPGERAAVQEFKQVNAMFQTTHRSLARLASATAILHTEITRSMGRSQPNSNSSPSMPTPNTVTVGP